MADLTTVEKLTKYRFRDASVAEEALTAAGVAKSSGKQDTGQRRQYGNKRLALIGDALIRLVVVDDWYPSGLSPGTQERNALDESTDGVQLMHRRTSVRSLPTMFSH